MEENLKGLNVLRAIAILSVVLGHSIIIFSGNWNYFHVLSSSNFLMFVKKVIDTYQMPVFMFISGYLFYCFRSKAAYNDFFVFLKKKTKRLLIPFMCVSLFWIMPIRTMINFQNVNSQHIVHRFFYNFILNHLSGNLWYLPTLFGIFIIFYFLKSKIETYWIISGGVALIVSLLSGVFPDAFYLHNMAYYFIYFYFGFCYTIIVDHLKIEKRLRRNSTLLLLGIALILLSVINTNKVISISAGIIGIVFFYELSLKFASKKIGNNIILKTIDKNSYGIYLFHSTLIYPILNFYDGKYINPYLLSFEIFICILMISLVITIILRKSYYLRFVIGE